MSLDIWTTCPQCGQSVADMNATHNLVDMWRAAGVYELLYDSAGKPASILIDPVHEAITDMLTNPAKYRALEPINGWGTYEGAIRFLYLLRNRALQCPSALIGVWK
jgi:hypothetical protein